MKGLYGDMCGYCLDAALVAMDGVKFIVTREAPPPLAELEPSLNNVKGIFAGRFGYSLDEAVVA